MKTRISILTAILMLGFSLNQLKAQVCTAKPLMSVGDEIISTGDFLRVYKKNNKNAEMSEASLREYLDLYVKFRLKVKEAKELKLDTNAAFIKELSGYRDQLAQPYLTDSNTINKLLGEAYERKQWDVKASHILIKIPQNPSAKDTLDAYNKILALRTRILKGEDFGALAKQYSEDPSANDRVDQQSKRNIKGNKGDLGYFTAFDMVYPFETAAYNTKIGEISMPVRTNFGYHIIKLVDKKSAMGMVQAAHIFLMMSPTSSDSINKSVKTRIDEIYNMYVKGVPFDSLAKTYSDDKVTGANGGVLRWFGVSKMVPEFIETIYTLKNIGDVSHPIQTDYGWHIIKLLARKPIGTLNELKPEMKTKIAKDVRAALSKEVLVNNAKKEYGFVEIKNMLKPFYAIIDTTIYTGAWSVDKAKGLNATMFTIGAKNVNQQDFAKYISSNQFIPKGSNFNTYVNNLYDKYMQEICLDYLNTHLEDTYPEFKALMEEYRDGMLLFELTDKKVWTKAIKDTAGLSGYYDKNKNNYMWKDRVNAIVYTCATTDISKQVRKLIKKKVSNKTILETINKENKTALSIDSSSYQKGENKLIDELPWTVGITSDVTNDSKIKFVNIIAVLAPQPKKLEECKGLVTSDYQNVLEKTWIDELKVKYPIKIEEANFTELYNK